MTVAVVLIAVGLWVAQEPARPALAPQPAVSPDGTASPNPECSLRRVVEELVDEDVLDCGLGWDGEVDAESDLEALSCVVESLESGKDFLFHNAAPGIDSFFAVAVISRNGRYYVLNWDSNSMGGPGYLERLVLYEPESWEIQEAKDAWKEAFAGRMVPKGQRYPRFQGDREQSICRGGVRVLQELAIRE